MATAATKMTTKRGGKTPWFGNFHFDLNYSGPAKSLLRRRQFKLQVRKITTRVSYKPDIFSHQQEHEGAVSTTMIGRLDDETQWPKLGCSSMMEEDWVCLDPRPLYTEALLYKSNANNNLVDESASMASSIWMLVDEHETDSLSFVEEEILLFDEEQQKQQQQETEVFFGEED